VGGGSGGGSTTSGPLECVGCVAQGCPDLVDCARDPSCYERLLCTVNECFDGGASIPCFLECNDNDPIAAQELAEALECAAMTCADRCDFGQ